ncbi:hypothetical protein I532_03845 [Brevibacillus borstelensis AK1]|uniref:DUF2577 domain-containing protein n=1 Tax=Brevibacillus borstelensis AK1 TaxID=1300222 RepID=M8DMK8_9BACL|nr:DUF2577 domain-containing protein [Brevibacillus borstelensis]EMT54707.1 hypothetical protein I532_03845 [Brevibacillus borstelensis AK1]
MTTRLEGSGASQLAQLIQKIGYNDFDRFELATIVSPPPAIRIKIDNVDGITFEADDLVVAEHLTRHKRIVTIKHVQDTERDVGDTIPFPRDNDSTGSLAWTYSYVEMTFEDVLKSGDRVLVASMNDGQAYVILDRVVQYGS